MEGAGKRKATHRTTRSAVRPDGRALLQAVGVTFCVVAWGYLVYAAIDFGTQARDGRGEAWLFLLVSCLGAVCCLFAGLLIGARLLASLGLTRPPNPDGEPEPPRPVGGRRAAR